MSTQKAVVMKINFYLKSAYTADKRIFVYLSLNGERWPAPTGIKTDPKNWNPKKQRLIKGPDTVAQNAILQRIEEKVAKRYWKLINKEQRRITKHEFLQLVKDLTGRGKASSPSPKRISFMDYAYAWMQNKKDTGAIVQSSYDVQITYLDKIQRFYRIHPFEFEDVNQEWFARFHQFGIQQRWRQNTLRQYLSLIKSILTSAQLDGLHTSIAWKRLRISKEEPVQKVYVSIAQLEELYHYTPSSEVLKRTRDEFLLAALTGLRFSDSSRVSATRIEDTQEGRIIKMTTQKRKSMAIIPVHPIVEEILANWGGEIPSVSIGQQNELVKNLFKEAGFNRKIFQSYTKAGQRIEEVCEFWELVTTHTARRSLATNLHMAGLSLKTIKAITGHKSTKQLEDYICTTVEESAVIAAKCSVYAGFKVRPA